MTRSKIGPAAPRWMRAEKVTVTGYYWITWPTETESRNIRWVSKTCPAAGPAYYFGPITPPEWTGVEP